MLKIYFYGKLQELAIMFARTLRGIGKLNDDTKVLDMLKDLTSRMKNTREPFGDGAR